MSTVEQSIPPLVAGDMARVLAVLNDGLATAEHRAFVERLAARKVAGAG